MADERDYTSLTDKCVDNLSDVPDEFEDSSDEDMIPLQEDPSDAEYSNPIIEMQSNRRTVLLPSEEKKFSSERNFLSEENEDMESDWSDFDPPKDNEPFTGFPGPNVLFPTSTCKVEDFVNLFLGDDLFEFIASETNKYYAQNSNRYKMHKKSPKWCDVTVGELKKWFALVIMMGLVKKLRIDDYWTTNPLIETPIFSKTMSRNRFRQILAFIHFSDNANMPDNADRLFKIQHIIDYFSKKFQENFDLGHNISIHESMIPWRGKLHFKVYNPSKIIKSGILIRMLCDSATGYISSFKIYSGAEQSLNSTIMELLTHSFGKWHHLYMDDSYNSVEVARNLLLNKIRVCGTIRQNQGLPNSFKNAKLKVFETISKRRGEILLQLWKTKTRDVRMISTIHNGEIVDTGKMCRKTNRPIQKPKCIMDYNQHMKRVDRADQYLSYYPIYRKTIKWPKKVVLYLFSCGLFNAFRVYQHFNVNSTRTLQFHDFLLNLSKAWITDILPKTEENLEVPTTSRAPRHDSIRRLSGHLKQHQLVQISETDKRKRRRCHVCYSHKIRKTTNLMCKSCKVALHLGHCFESYHVKKHY